MEEVADKYKILLKKFRTRENGPAVESMNRMGLAYKRNFGIALAEIKSFAAQYKGDQKFALFLWEKTSREAKILSLMIADPLKLSDEQIENYLQRINNVELAEQAVLNLFGQLPDKVKYSLNWCNRKGLYERLSGLLLLSKITITDKTLGEKVFAQFLNSFKEIAKENNFHIKRGMSRALMQIAKHSGFLKQEVLNFIQSVDGYNKEMALWLNEEVAYYLRNEV